MSEKHDQYCRVTGEIPEWNQENADGFERMAADIFQPLYRYLIKDIESAWGRSLHGARVLELGGGPGQMAAEFLDAGVERLVEVDVSPAMMKKLEERIAGNPGRNRVEKRVADVCHLPGDVGRFDLVFSRGSVQFWNDLEHVFGGMPARVLPGGLVYIGGGYGISTPDHVKHTIMAKRAEREAQSGKPCVIPSLDHDKVFQLVQGIGGEVRMHCDGPGFWIEWFPHGRQTGR